MTRDEAITIGAKRYDPGAPCANGHTAQRFVKSGICVVCDKVNQAAWRERNRERERLRSVARREANPEYRKQYYYQNRERALALDKEYREANAEQTRARIAAWAKDNPEKRAAGWRRRRAKVAGAPGDHTAKQARFLRVMQGNMCAYCEHPLELTKPHLDHVVPISRGGSNAIENLLWACAPCNLSKGAKTLEEWGKTPLTPCVERN